MVMKGWFHESYRHGLSARGIKTSKVKSHSKKMKYDWTFHRPYFAEKELTAEEYSLVKDLMASGMSKKDALLEVESRSHGPRSSEDMVKEKRYMSEKLIGGLADGLPDWKFDPDQLYIGTQHEMEHTNDPETAEEITKDHLTENPDYYKPGNPGYEGEKSEKMGVFSWMDQRAHNKDVEEVKRLYSAKKDSVNYFEPDEEPGKYGKVSFAESVWGAPLPGVKIAAFEPKLPETKAGVQREIAKTSDIMAADIASGKRPNVQDEIREFELERKRAGLASGDEQEFYRREKLARLEGIK